MDFQLENISSASDESSKDGIAFRNLRWTLKGINYSRGYAKLVNVSTGEKRYASLYDFPGYRTRLSKCTFLKASSAVGRRDYVWERLQRMKAYANKEN